MPKIALPGLLTGILGIAAGALAFTLDQPLLGLVAGVLALAAAVAGIQTARQLEQELETQAIMKKELKSVSEAAKATEDRVKNELLRLEEEAEQVDDALTDSETGLFSESFFRASLESRVAAARRHLRPIAVALIDVVNGLPDSSPTQAKPYDVAPAVKETLRGADTACRLESGYFAVLLEDTPENGAIWTVERIRRRLTESYPNMTVWAGVACYPAHAFGPEEILQAAEEALTNAREWRQDRIEVAAVASD